MRSAGGRAREGLRDAGRVGVVHVHEARAALTQLVREPARGVPQHRDAPASHKGLDVGREHERGVQAAE